MMRINSYEALIGNTSQFNLAKTFYNLSFIERIILLFIYLYINLILIFLIS